MAELIRLRWLGYIRYRDLVVGGVISFVLLTGVVTVVPMNRFYMGVLGTLTVIAVGLALFGSAITHRRQVNIYTAGGLYIAEHLETGYVRHGETPEAALTNLVVVLESHGSGGRDAPDLGD